MDGINIIAAERARHALKGFDAAHDDGNSAEHLVMAAVCYALPDGDRSYSPSLNVPGDGPPEEWPWEPESWKPTPGDRIHELAVAGSLIAAEIDRLQRIAARKDVT